VLACAGFLSLFWSTLAGSDNVALGAARPGIRPGTTGAPLTSIGKIVPIGLASSIFVLGHVLGLVLLGIALWRGRVVPAWAGLLLAASQVLHVLFAVIVPVHALDGLAWGSDRGGLRRRGRGTHPRARTRSELSTATRRRCLAGAHRSPRE
jgi:hypothetical protein